MKYTLTASKRQKKQAKRKKMNNKCIDTIMKTMLKSKWGGIFPCDKIPKTICKKCNIGIICNTKGSGKKGEHWIAIYLPKSGLIEYFDSFARKPKNTFFLQFINKSRYIFNKKIYND